MPSFLPAFLAIQKELEQEFDLIGDYMLIEEMPPEEAKTAGGIHLATSAIDKQIDGLEANRPVFVRVLLVGKGFYDPKSEEIIPVDVAPGAIALVGRMSVKWLSVFGPIISARSQQLGLIRESDIQLHFKNADSQKKVYEMLAAELSKTF